MNQILEQSQLAVSVPVEPYRSFPLELLPPVACRYVAEASESIGCDPAYVALPLLAALAASVGGTRVIELKRGWSEPPILWTAVIGESGTHKTPAQKTALQCIRAIESRMFDEFNEAKQLHDEEIAQHEETKRQWRKVQHGPPPVEPDPPSLKRLICGDTTVEALAGLLAENPRGMVLVRDELSGWLGSFNAYKSGAGDESQWLELHQGNALTIDRKTGTPPLIHVPRSSLSLTGGIQPGILRDLFGKSKYESGLAARCLMAYPPMRAKRWHDLEMNDETIAAMRQVFERLYGLGMGINGEPLRVPLLPDAKSAFIEFVNEHGAEQAKLSGALSSAWSKLEAYAARFALIFHECRVAEGDPAMVDRNAVDAVSISSGVALARWFGYETRRIYAVLSGDERSMQGHKLAEFIRRRGGRVTLRDLQRGVYSGQQAATIRAQLRPHLDSGWLEAVQMPAGAGGGRPSECYRLTDTMTTDKTPADDQSQGVLSVSHGGEGGE